MSVPRDLQKLEQPESLAERAYASLREGIATGLFTPGERVTERGLAARLGVSPTPIREALRRLEHEGLIVRLGPRRLAVAEHSDRALRELMHVEVVLRAAQARFATTRLTDATLDRLAEIVEQIANPVGEDPAAQQRAAHRFDEILAEAAGNAVVDGLIGSVSLFGAERRARSLQQMQQRPDVFAERVAAHREVLAALRRRDPDTVETAMRAHLLRVVDFLLEID
ncbi:GntR family transcriptional regulator [Pseudonocardia kujensis]|uniref:GntR family transcriptional regulator n=1 Tax=Pseudonocardia kujensis TaxID=1128675 RepID=UPI001E46BD8E|nr:GntR family transcriptional regulator [Pseudonocardia kujensis]MCE0763704.1 GntR family transcriptional regulator [Pseudonocardia kujensis]